MKIGICFGGYCPMHQGHLDVIMQTKKENDVCFVVVCGYDNEPRSWEINLNLNERYNLINNFFCQDEQIIVIKVNDSELEIDESMSDYNWTVWQNKVKELIFTDKHWRGKYIGWDKFDELTSEITFYVAEPFYKTSIERNNVMNSKVVLIDKLNPVSGTLIRNNHIKYFNKITRPFKPYLCHNVLILGTASEGKSTLVRDISNYFDIPYAWEYGRGYMEDRNMTDVELEYDDFEKFLKGQIALCNRTREQSKNGIFISDTDNCVTLMYALAYSEDPIIHVSKEDYNKLYELAKELQDKNKFKWDKIFIFPPNQNFVDDGTRYMQQASMNERKKNFTRLQRLIQEFYPEVSKTYLIGTFLENYNEVKNYINGILG
jgi:NadR type nicotinamide-nucleotide adenylyltransferase